MRKDEFAQTANAEAPKVYLGDILVKRVIYDHYPIEGGGTATYGQAVDNALVESVKKSVDHGGEVIGFEIELTKEASAALRQRVLDGSYYY